MARSTCNDLLTQLRGLAQVDYAMYSRGTAQYWDDDQLQAVLDRHRFDFHAEPLVAYPSTLAGGTLEWKEYRSAYRNLEQTDGGTALFVIEDTTGADVTTGYNVDYVNGIVLFTADRAGTAYRLTGRAYNLNAAAADVWRAKAGYYAEAYDFSTDNHSLSRSQLMKQALQMADYYSSMGGASVAQLIRSDLC
jgi:hypothetical protein